MEQILKYKKNEITQALKNRMNDSIYNKKWFIEWDEDFERDYSTSTIAIKDIPKNYKGNILSIGLQQNTQKNKYRIYYGLCWGQPQKSTPELEIYHKLVQLSIDAGLSDKTPSSWWWPAVNELDTYLRSDEFALQYGLNRKEYINELAESIWTFFESIEAEAYQLNQELINQQ